MRPEMVRVVCQDLLADHGPKIPCATIRCRTMQKVVRPVAATALGRKKVWPHRRPTRIQVWINLMLIQLLLLNIKPKIIIRIYMVVVVVILREQKPKNHNTKRKLFEHHVLHQIRQHVDKSHSFTHPLLLPFLNVDIAFVHIYYCNLLLEFRERPKGNPIQELHFWILMNSIHTQ